jgi:hypothetical protein
MHCLKKIALLTGLLSAQAFAAETAPGINNLTKPFNEYSWVTTHNDNRNALRAQLDRGVRGFMLDLHPGNLGGEADIYLCHTAGQGTCDVRRHMKFTDALNDVFLPFLRGHPSAVVTLLLASQVERANLSHALEHVPGLADWVLDPAAYSASSTWPTLKQMIADGRRLVILTDRQAGNYVAQGKNIAVLGASLWENQNYWDFGVTTSESEWRCPSRWSRHYPSVAATGFTQWPRLFVMDHFDSWGATANHAGERDFNLSWLERRVDLQCASTLGERPAPNFLAIDLNQNGDALAYAAALTQGGVYFYGRNQADSTGDTLCVIPAGQDYNFDLPGHGCANDTARSLKLRGVAEGTRITVHDAVDGDTRDDHAFIDIKRNIGLDESATVGTFEANYENADFKLTYVRNDGLDGKVSRIAIGPVPLDFADASVVLYEGSSASQNIVCKVSLAADDHFNFGNRCKNDEARSARILNAKAGTSFSLYGGWNQTESQGYARVDILSDITHPVVVEGFEENYNAGSWRITRGGSADPLNGKVSSMKVEHP